MGVIKLRGQIFLYLWVKYLTLFGCQILLYVGVKSFLSLVKFLFIPVSNITLFVQFAIFLRTLKLFSYNIKI